MLRDYISSPEPTLKPSEDVESIGKAPFPAAIYREERLHILQHLVTNPPNTYFFEAGSDEMELFGIKHGTLLVVDRSERPVGGMIVIVWHHGEWLVRQLITHINKKYLSTGKEEDGLEEIKDDAQIVIWGVVTWSCCPQIEVKKF